jgi:hypothetical protein
MVGMAFTFTYPVYAFVETSSTDSRGTTTFANPLAITCTSVGDKPIALEAVPIFTTDAQSIAFHKATGPIHKRRLRIKAHDHLIDFLIKARSRAMYVAMDPTPTTLTSDRIWKIEQVVEEVRIQAAQGSRPGSGG